MRVQVCIPHYFREATGQGPTQPGHGSLMPGARAVRSLALHRCLAALLELPHNRAAAHQDLLLNHGDYRLERLPAVPPATSGSLDGPAPLDLRITVCTTGGHYLEEVLSLYTHRIEILSFQLDDPGKLPLASRDYLLQQTEAADLYLYLEDDLVIHDPLFFAKQAWFHQLTQDGFCLMPHRYERLDLLGESTAHPGGKLLVDGPLDPAFIGRFYTPRTEVCRGTFGSMGPIRFDAPANPHSGSFCLSRNQQQALQAQELIYDTSLFIGHLETAATMTVLQHVPIVKPALDQREFLMIEHAHAVYLSYVDVLAVGPESAS